LEATAKGEANRRLQSTTTIIVSLSGEMFGLEEKRAAPLHHEQQSKQELPAQTGVEEPEAAIQGGEGGAELRSILHKKLMTLRGAEGHRRRRKERARKRTAFLANLFVLVS